MASHPTFARTRRQVLARPGFTRLPVCPHCGKEIALLEYAKHTRECEKAPPPPPPAAASDTVESTPQKGLIYALFDARAVSRLERAGAEILQLRQELREQHDRLTSTDRVERCRELARRECLSMALVVAQLRRRFAIQGTGAAFIPGIRAHVIDEHFREAVAELVRMSDPAVWGAA